MAAAGVTKGPILVLLNEKINDNLITMDFLKEKFDSRYAANIPEGQKSMAEASLRFSNRTQNNGLYESKLSSSNRPIKFLTISAIKGYVIFYFHLVINFSFYLPNVLAQNWSKRSL